MDHFFKAQAKGKKQIEKNKHAKKWPQKVEKNHMLSHDNM